jgi:DNA-binding beta-propeller fold protein YncE
MTQELNWVSLFFLALAACKNVSYPASDNFPPASEPAFVHQARFAITNNLSDTMSFIAADGMGANLGYAPVGDNPVELEGPHHLAGSPDGKFIYYNLSNYAPGTGSGPHGNHGTGAVPGSLVKLDAATMENLGEAGIGRSPGDVILNKAGTLAFVTHYDLLAVLSTLQAGGTEADAYSPLAIVDTSTMTRLSLTPMCVTAHGEALSADENTLYATCAFTDELAIVDVSNPKSPTVTARVPVGPTPAKFGGPTGNYGPYALAVSPKDGTVWISDNTSGDIRVYDPSQAKMDPARTVQFGVDTMFGAFSQDGGTYYVPLRSTATLARIDAATRATTMLPVPPDGCEKAHAFVMTPDQTSGVMVCEGDMTATRSGQVVTINVPAFSIAQSVQTGVFSDGAAWLPALP